MSQQCFAWLPAHPTHGLKIEAHNAFDAAVKFCERRFATLPPPNEREFTVAVVDSFGKHHDVVVTFEMVPTFTAIRP